MLLLFKNVRNLWDFIHLPTGIVLQDFTNFTIGTFHSNYISIFSNFIPFFVIFIVYRQNLVISFAFLSNINILCKVVNICNNVLHFLDLKVQETYIYYYGRKLLTKLDARTIVQGGHISRVTSRRATKH